jgi:hypothetical protein
LSSTFILHGLASVDAHLAAGTTVERCADGLALTHASSGTRLFLATDRPPLPGSPVTALRSLTPLLDSPLVGRRAAGGGALRVGIALARRSRVEQRPATVHVLTSGTLTPELAKGCGRRGVVCHPLARQEAPCRLVLPGHDRTVIQGPTTPAPLLLDDAQRDAVLRLGDHAGAVASVSSKDGALTAAAMAAGNGARRYFRPTGALPPEMTQLLLLTAHEVVGNFAEWARLGMFIAKAFPGLDEESDQAPEAAAELLRALHRWGWAGHEAAVCTLGRRGSVVADWVRDRVYRVGLERTDSSPAVPAPRGAGDRFLAEWIYWRQTWSNQGHLRDPLAATAVRATCNVARALGLRRGSHEVRTSVC